MTKRKYVGMPPKDGVLVGQNEGALVFFVPSKSDEKFLWMKVVMKQPHRHKANYWLTWIRSESRFAKGRDYKILNQHEGSLLDSIESLVSAWGAEACTT